jgi:hypothetical protein
MDDHIPISMDLLQRTASLARCFAWGLACVFWLPCAAQLNTRPEPQISRMCLWNGDRSMWSELGLTKRQIVKLENIRKRYPAVVDGQWLDEQLLQSVQETAPSEKGGAGGPDAPTIDKERPKTPPVKSEGLQAELRTVLSEEQLEHWQLLCAGPVAD